MSNRDRQRDREIETETQRWRRREPRPGRRGLRAGGRNGLWSGDQSRWKVGP